MRKWPVGTRWVTGGTDRGDRLPLAERRFRLVVIATDVTRGELAYFPWDYEGTYGLEPRGQLVVDAVRASMSIPFFFEPVILKGSDGISSTLVDGGCWRTFRSTSSTVPTDGRRAGRRSGSSCFLVYRWMRPRSCPSPACSGTAPSPWLRTWR